MRSDSQQQGGDSVMSTNNKEDDEDELEALRLAALESLRAKGLPPPVLPVQQRLSPKHTIPNNPIFQRHFGNQNLIAIIPVEQSSASSSPYHNSSPHRPPLLESKGLPSLPRSSSNRPPLLSTPPSSTLIIHNRDAVEEKPKHTTKFSRFEDSDSDESDDNEMSYAKSESEEEEFVVEEGDADDLIIEVEDEIVDEVVIEEFIEEIETPPTTITNSRSDSCEIPTSNSTPSRVLAEPSKEDSLPKDVKSTDTNRRIESSDAVKRSPRATRSPPYTRRRSPSRRSPPARGQKSPVQKSPVRSQRSPQRVRSPSRAQRSPVRGYRSPVRVQRSPHRTQRSPVRSSDRTDKLKLKESKTGSGSDRSVSDEAKKSDKSRTASDQRRTKDKSRSPVADRKPVLRRSPPRSTANDRESRKQATPSPTDSEKDRLESRKRKFQVAPDNEASLKKEGKIRLKAETTRPPSPVQVKRKEDKSGKRNETEVIHVRREEPMGLMESTEEDDDKKQKRNNKRSNKKSKDKTVRNKKSQSGAEQDNGPVVFSGKEKESSSDAHIDLRAELQRRRVHRYEDEEEPRSRTPETRRILVLNSPAPSNPVAPSKSSTEPTGVLSKHQRLGVSDGQTKPKSSSESLAKSKRNGGQVKLKRTLLATPIEMDQGTETDPLEDRIRQIRVQNELIRKRQQEIEADKLQYA